MSDPEYKPTIPPTPTGIVRDHPLCEDVELTDSCVGCGYQGYDFGANYLDSVCFDGYLWDADSGDARDDGEGWVYTNGGDIPCPHCNHQEWATNAVDECFDAGYQQDVPRDQCPYNKGSRFDHLTEVFKAEWLRGWDDSGDNKTATPQAAEGEGNEN